MRLSIVATAVTMFMACSKEKTEEGNYLNAIPENATAIMYVDGYQMVQKSGLLDQIKPIRPAAAKQVANMVDKNYSKFAEEIILDFDNTGIATSEPMYMAITTTDIDNDTEAVIVAKVLDKGKVDRIVDIMKENGMEIGVETTDGCTIVSMNNDVFCIGYNESTFVLASVSRNKNSRQLAVNTLKAAYTPRQTELPDFKDYDMATYIDVNKVLELAKTQLNDEPDLSAVCDQYAGASFEGMILGLTFNPGHILLNCNLLGLSDESKEMTESICSHSTTNEYLKYLPIDTYAVLNGYIDGKQIFDTIMGIPALQEQIDQMKENESEEDWQQTMDLTKQICYSFDGDMTMAVNSIGSNVTDETDVKASIMATVKDDSVMSLFNIYKGILGDGITQTGDNQYRTRLDDPTTAYFGQLGSMLYVSTDGVPAPAPRSAADAAWVKDIEGAKAFVVVNLRKLFADQYINTMMWREIYNDRQVGDIVRNLINMLDYAYVRDTDTANGVLDIVLLDQNDNALKQIVDTILPVVMQNIPLGTLLQ